MDSRTILILENLVELLEVPNSAYEKAINRYQDLADFFSDPESQCGQFSPEFYSQGSFKIGTAIRPLNSSEHYDLDLSCNLRAGITKETHTQSQLKKLVGNDLERYRRSRGIEEKREEKRRCWRLTYADSLSFHMDIVPAIPETEDLKEHLASQIFAREGNAALASEIASEATLITDIESRAFHRISDDWNVSNPQGYARWFENQSKLAERHLQERAIALGASRVEDIPLYRWKTPLQRSIQLLKRHRDQMYRDNPDCKPSSIIITTLSARAYNGEYTVPDALTNILETMDSYIGASSPRIPNPVQPEEDFSDRWNTEEGRQLALERHFHLWLTQARRDFEVLLNDSMDASPLADNLESQFKVRVSKQRLLEAGVCDQATSPQAKSGTSIEMPSQPWVRK